MLSEARRVFEVAPFIQYIGCHLDELAEGTCKTSIQLQEHHLQQDGFVHAGVQATLADHTAGTAGVTLIKDGQMVLTAEFKINLLKAAKGERLLCEAKVLKPGRMLSVVESEVFVQSGEQEPVLVAKATVTLAVIDKPE